MCGGSEVRIPSIFSEICSALRVARRGRDGKIGAGTMMRRHVCRDRWTVHLPGHGVQRVGDWFACVELCLELGYRKWCHVPTEGGS